MILKVQMAMPALTGDVITFSAEAMVDDEENAHQLGEDFKVCIRAFARGYDSVALGEE